MRFLIPTYQRNDRIQTVNYLTQDCGIAPSLITISTQCRSDYEAQKELCKGCNVVFRPGDNVSMNRNFGLQTIRRQFPGEDICCMDDDVKHISLLLKEGDHRTAKMEVLKGGRLAEVLSACFDDARKRGATLFGISALDNPFFMRQTTLQNVLMPAILFGFVGGGGQFLFDQTFFMKEDYELVLRIAQNGGKTLKYCFLAPKTKYYAPGGCEESRNSHSEQEFADRLLAKYEGLICADPKRPGEVKMLR